MVRFFSQFYLVDFKIEEYFLKILLLYCCTALGFHHMQCAYDRNDYVKIHYENIKLGKEHNFKKYTSTEVTHFNTTYDYYSILHYSAYGFSKNKAPTIVPTVS